MGNNGYAGSPFKFNSGYGLSGPMYLFHNTADAALPGSNGIYIKAPGTWETIYARNNIWSGPDYTLNNYNETQPIDFDYDDLYTTNPGEFVYWGSGSDRHMHDLATFQSLTGQVIDPGGVATYVIGVQPPTGGPCPVTLSTINSSPALGVSLDPTMVTPPGQAILTLTDTQSSASSGQTAALTRLPGLWHTVSVTGTGGGFTVVVWVDLLVGGHSLLLTVDP